MKSLNTLLRLFSKSAAPGAANAAPTGRGQRPRPAALEHESMLNAGARAFEDRLLKSVQQAGRAVSGRLMVLNIEAVKARLGDRWDRYRPNIHRHIEATLARHLGPKDVFHRHGEMDYAIAFADFGEAAAGIKIHAIGQEILARLFGSDGELEGLSVKSAVREIDESVHFDTASTIAHLDESLRDAPVIALDAADFPASAEPVSTNSDGGTASNDAALAQLRELIAEAESTLERLLGLPGSVRQAEMQALQSFILSSLAKLDALLQGANRGDSVSSCSEALRDELAGGKDRLNALIARVDRELAAGNAHSLSTDDHIEALLTPESVEFSYRPIWNRDQAVISTYRSSCNIRSADSLVCAEDLLGRSRHPAIDIALDRLLLKRATLYLRRMAFEDSPPHALSVPVHKATLAGNRSLHAYVHLCAAIPADAKRYLVFEIIETDETSWHSRTAGLAWYLRAHCRAVFVRSTLAERDFECYRQRQIFGLTVDLAADCHRREADQIAHAERFIACCQRHKLKSAFLGVDSPAVAAALIRAGVNFMAGEIIAPDTPSPAGIQPLQLNIPAINDRQLH